MDIDPGEVMDACVVTLSGAVTLIEYQRRGFALVPSSTNVG